MKKFFNDLFVNLMLFVKYAFYVLWGISYIAILNFLFPHSITEILPAIYCWGLLIYIIYRGRNNYHWQLSFSFALITTITNFFIFYIYK